MVLRNKRAYQSWKVIKDFFFIKNKRFPLFQQAVKECRRSEWLNKDLLVRLKHEKEMQTIEPEIYILERIQGLLHRFEGVGSEKVRHSHRRIWQGM